MASEKWPLPPQDPRDSADPRSRGRSFDPRQDSDREYGDPGNGDSRRSSRSPDPRYRDHPPRRPVDPRPADPDPRLPRDPRSTADPRRADPSVAADRRQPAGDLRLIADPRHAADSDPWDLAGLTKPMSPRPSSGPLRELEPPRPPEQLPPTARLVAPGQPDAAASPGPVAAQVRPADRPRRSGENTRSVHLPPAAAAQAAASQASTGQVSAPSGPQSLSTAVHRQTDVTFQSSAEYAAALDDLAAGPGYCSIANPTVEAFCAAVASLEGINLPYQVTAQAFASGAAAMSTVLWALTRAGAHVIAPSAVHSSTARFLHNVAANFGVLTDFVDTADLGQVRSALRQGTAVVIAETLMNPAMAVADLPGLARLAHEAGALLVVDSTLAPPVICRPLEHGADLVVHSATAYFGGHCDATGGVVTGHPELIKTIGRFRMDTGGSLCPDDAYQLRRGLETLPLRVRRQCSTAQLLAASIARHPAVRTVYYPGLINHPGHGLARRQFDAGPEGTRYGAVLTIAPYGGHEAGQAFADRLRLAQIATSLGGTRTKVSHLASTTHRQFHDAGLVAAGIDPGSVRFSIGLEDGEDLLADATAALDSLGHALWGNARNAGNTGNVW